MAGRPKFEITDEIIKKVEALAAQGLSLEQIASVIGCSADTVGRRKKDNAKFADAIKRGQNKGIATITNALFQKAKTGDNAAMIFYLKNRDPENWREKQFIEQNTNLTHNIMPVPSCDSVEEWEQAAQQQQDGALKS